MARGRFTSLEVAEEEPKAVQGSPRRAEWRALDRVQGIIRGWLQGVTKSVGQAKVWALDLLL